MPDDALALTPALVVDDDPSMQRRLARMLRDIEVGAEVATAGNLAEAHGLLAGRAFAIALVDIGLPDGNGCELVAWLNRHRPAMQVVVISAWGDEDTVMAALRAGAIGYLLKEREDIELILSLKSIRRGGAPIDPAIARRILALLPKAAPKAALEASAQVHLSEREHEILELVSRGCSNREIAELVSLSKLTIEGYTKSIYRKLAVGSRTEAVHEAKALGLLQ